jgi:membrane-associated HD superfamily phosphohydrolase
MAMNTEYFFKKILPVLKLMPAINFNAAVIFLLIVSLISASGSTLFFDNNSDLYGPLASNLQLMLIYLTLSQFTVYCFCSYSQNYRLLLPVALFWFLLMGSIEFYGKINQILIDEAYRWFFLYMGISNLAYGVYYDFNKYLRPDIK